MSYLIAIDFMIVISLYTELYIFLEEWLLLCFLVNYGVSPLREKLQIYSCTEMQEILILTGNIDSQKQYKIHLNITVYKFENMKFKNTLLIANVFHEIRFKLFCIFDKKSKSILAKPKLCRLDSLI